MEQRLFRLFALAIIPFVLVIGLITIFWLIRSHQVGNFTIAWTNSTPITFGIQAMITLTATLVLIAAKFLARFSATPMKVFLAEVNNVTVLQEAHSPQLTGVKEIDDTLHNLYQSATDAQQRLRAERTLAADVSHQLRSPLTALSLRLEQIVADSASTRTQADATAALAQVDRLVRLVEGLLTTWRATSDRELSEIEVSKLVANVTARWQSRVAAESRSFEIVGELDLIALGTPEIQELVLSVLIENSLQHGAGTIRISYRDYQSWVLIEVSDEGKGISIDIENSLMLQGNTTGGTGLGLAWARSQVSIDGGRLELRNLKPATFGIFLMSANK